jgi:hypothetical protein
MSLNIPHFQPTMPLDEMEEAQPKRGMSSGQKITVILLDLIMLAELAVAMAWASKHPDSFTSEFAKIFFLMLVPTMAVGFFIIRRIGRIAGRNNA